MKHLSYDAIREYANRVVAHHALRSGSTGETDISQLCRNLSIMIHRPDMGTSLALPHIIKEPTKTTFLIQQFQSERRQRFMVAHLLGHYYLHHLNQDPQAGFVFRCNHDNSLEVEANVFASELLVPEYALVAYQEKQPEADSFEIASHFDVSPKLIMTRISQQPTAATLAVSSDS